jgi:hypothetical protein
MRIYNVIHVCRLSAAASDPFSGQVIPYSPPVEVDGNEEWIVERIVDSKIWYGPVQYRVKWLGYEEPTWEPFRNVQDLEDRDEFHRRCPNKPVHPDYTTSQELVT